MTKKRHTTKTPGVSYRLHATRRHGVNFDRYYSIRFQSKGQRLEEGVGWASEGWTEKKVAAVLAELKNNTTMGTGPRSLTEKREEEDNRRREEEIKAELNQRLLFKNVFNLYCAANQHKVSLQTEIGYFNSWLKSAIGQRQLDQIHLYHLDNIRKKMEEAGRKWRTINYIKAIIRQTYNFAIKHKLYSGEVPTTHFSPGEKVDNERKKFLTPKEADMIMTEVKKRSPNVHRICMLSLHTGMRFGEVAALRWQHVDMQERSLMAVDTKNGSSRYIFLNTEAMKVLLELPKGLPGDLLFPNKFGKKMNRISRTFERAIKASKINDGITDARMKVVPHTMRHTYASWLRKYAGADIMVIKEALGHKTLAMTVRYTKVDDHDLRDAVNKIENIK